MSWGATADERRAPLPGDGWLPQEPGRMRIAMTRAVTIAAPVDDVWPWVAQLGRGAGWYSYDAVDNGRRGSASHLVSWIPAPRLGDASAIGYIRHLEPNRSVAWWAPGERWLGADVRMVVDMGQEDIADIGNPIAMRLQATFQGGDGGTRTGFDQDGALPVGGEISGDGAGST